MTHTFHLIRESIRTNGYAYTASTLAYAGDIAGVGIVDALVNLNMQTDWLAMRQRWNAQGFESKAEVIRLTTTTR